MTTYLHTMTSSLPGTFPPGEDKVKQYITIYGIDLHFSVSTALSVFFSSSNFEILWSNYFLFLQICTLPCTALGGGMKGCPTALFPHARNARILLLLLIPGQVCAPNGRLEQWPILAWRLDNCAMSFRSNVKFCPSRLKTLMYFS